MIAAIGASARGLAAESGVFRFLALLTGACTVLLVFAELGSGGGGPSSGGGTASGGGGGTTSQPPTFASQPASTAPAAPTTPAGGQQAYSFSQPAQAIPPAPVTVHQAVIVDSHHPNPLPGSAEPMLEGTSFAQLKSQS